MADRNLVANFRWLGVLPTLQQLTFDEVVDLWWYAQSLKADQEDWQRARVADPNSMVGKSPQYVAEWHAKRKLTEAPA